MIQPERRAYQSELKRLVYSKSWRKVVKRELSMWNQLIQEEFPDLCLVTAKTERNPQTGRRNEVLMRIHPGIEIKSKPTHFLVVMKRGDTNEK